MPFNVRVERLTAGRSLLPLYGNLGARASCWANIPSSFSQSSSLGIRRFGRTEYKYRDRYGSPDANTKTCPDSNANADVIHRYTETGTQYDTDEYAQRQSSYAPA